jgi:hypothetical protein
MERREDIRDNFAEDFEMTNPMPFIKPCYFCQKEVRMAKDATENQPVACFEHSWKFNLKVKV